MTKFQQPSAFSAIGAITSFCLASVAYAFETQAECEGAGGTWDTTATTCTIEAEGAAVTMSIDNPQTLSIVSLRGINDPPHVVKGTELFAYRANMPSVGWTYMFTRAAWGVKTNGRFSVGIANDFGSIIDDKGTTDTTDDVAMFGATPTITDDFGTTVTWPSFVKWETDAAGKKYDGTEITGTKRYEVLPASFSVEFFNIDSISGSLGLADLAHQPVGFNRAHWKGTGKQLAGIEANDTSNFSTQVGYIQVADQMGGTTGGIASYNFYSEAGDVWNLRTPDNFVTVIAIPEMDQTAAANAQAGTYYAAIKLTVTAEESI